MWDCAALLHLHRLLRLRVQLDSPTPTMQKIIDSTVAPDLLTANRLAGRPGYSATPISVPALWREALTTFSARSGPILLAAFLGYALATLLGVLLNGLITVDLYSRTGTILSSYGLSRSVPLLVQAVLGMFAGIAARGAITWLALARPGQHGAVRAIWVRLPELLPVLLLTGGIIFVGSLGVTSLLRELRLDLSEVSEFSLGLQSMGRSILLRILNSIIPDPGPPFTQVLDFMRSETTRVATSLVYAGGLSYYRVKTIEEIPLPLLVGGGSLFLLIGGDALFRFVPAALMQAGSNPLLGVVKALRLAGRHFGLVLMHIWVVRLVVFSVSAVFMIAPLVLVQSIGVPILIRSTGSAWILLAALMVASVSLALVGMVFTAFVTVYDACLYRQLAQYDAPASQSQR
jgi:hypothetical protein